MSHSETDNRLNIEQSLTKCPACLIHVWGKSASLLLGYVCLLFGKLCIYHAVSISQHFKCSKDRKADFRGMHLEDTVLCVDKTYKGLCA